MTVARATYGRRFLPPPPFAEVVCRLAAINVLRPAKPFLLCKTFKREKSYVTDFLPFRFDAIIKETAAPFRGFSSAGFCDGFLHSGYGARGGGGNVGQASL
jgi:hypothetical protein